MEKYSFIKKLLNISLLLFTIIFIGGISFIIKTFSTYSSIEENSLSLWENIFSIVFSISFFGIIAIIIIKIVIHFKTKKLNYK